MSQPQARRDIQNRVDATLRGLFDKAVDLSIYLRACERLLREGTGFQAEGNAGEAYRTLLMYVELIVTWLPQHPQFRDKQYASRLARVSRQVVKVLAELDRLKSVVDAQYDAFTEEQGRLAAERRSQQHKARQSLAARKDRPAATTSAAAQAKGAPVDEALLQQLRNLSLPTAAYAPLSTSSAGSSSFQYPDIPVAAVDVAETAAEPRSAPAIPPKTRAPTFPEVATLENGTSLKTVFVSSRFRQTFLDIAKSNTERRLETCGILAGSCRNNAYFVTHLIIPKQESTSDTCATTDEEALFNYQDENALFTIGWIHVRPSFSPNMMYRRLTSAADTSNTDMLPQLGRPTHAYGVPDHAARGCRHRLQSIENSIVGCLSNNRSARLTGVLRTSFGRASEC